MRNFFTFSNSAFACSPSFLYQDTSL
uniref:Uncharacterized protein n=1 Tax=Anguilla anguilla TaxID=7936 RepID=A0A0E9T7B9_ANGAN